MAEISEQSNSYSIGFAPLEMRIIKEEKSHSDNSASIQKRIEYLNHRLILNINVITPTPLTSFNFRKDLKNYRYERKNKSNNLFNQLTNTQEKQLQQLSATFIDIFSNWRDKLQNKIFIVFANGDLIYFFHKKQDEYSQNKTGGSFSILSCKKSNYSTIFKQSDIPYQTIQKTEYQNERLLLKGNSIQIFWKYLMNYTLEKSIGFEIVANFYFLNSLEVLPVENYNGKQQRPEFDHIAQKTQNILGDVQKSLYSLRIEGFWFKQNTERMFQSIQGQIKGKPFQMDFECHSGTSQIKQQIDKL